MQHPSFFESSVDIMETEFKVLVRWISVFLFLAIEIGDVCCTNSSKEFPEDNLPFTFPSFDFLHPLDNIDATPSNGTLYNFT